ncbi:hypothetical protein [Legionella waltersii]|uniref:Coiled-coil protein n=1 Tax=Legionella waltersii TaxID=66969 RepID=A0A0W1A5C2_9GAMM|nr:hypothetical protein [Legionella waltersii]KTD76527.1 coiled-coil protein [Legionella waltersii]SNU93942.1 coiled-coil protein [Legionella waltersii]
MLKTSSLKHNFFNRTNSSIPELSFTEEEFNLSLLSLEFSTLYELFLSNKERLQANNGMVLYLNFLCNYLISYYQTDYVAENLNQLLMKKNELDRFIEEQSIQNKRNKREPLEANCKAQPKKSSDEFIHSFVSSSKIRKHLSSFISNRSYWNYSRALSNHVINYLQKIGAVDSLKEINELFGLNYSPEELTALLDKPQIALRLLGFILYGLRFALNLLIMTKHVVLAALNPKLSSKKVLVQEVEKRSYTMSTDLFWGTVNLFNFFGPHWGIDAFLLAKVNLFFLMIDIALFFVLWHIENSQYQFCVNELLLQKHEATSSLERAIIERQIDILNDQKEIQQNYYLFNIAAANVFVLAFAASLIVSGPLTLIGLAAASMLGNAMYNTAEEYKQYRRSIADLKRETLNGTLVADDYHDVLMQNLRVEQAAAQTKFWKNLMFNTGFTALIITAAAVSWPIALSLTLVYIGCKTNNEDRWQPKQSESKPEHLNIYRLFNANSTNKPPRAEEAVSLPLSITE